MNCSKFCLAGIAGLGIIAFLLLSCKGNPGGTGPSGTDGTDGINYPTATATSAPATILSEDFENTMDAGWSFEYGAATYSTAQAKTGTYSLAFDNEAKKAWYSFGEALENVYISIWLYDDSADISTHLEITPTRMGISCGYSTTKYTYAVAGIQGIESSVTRTTGWHHIEYRQKDGTRKTYFDNVMVAEQLLATMSTMAVGCEFPTLVSDCVVDDLVIIKNYN